MFDFGVAGYAPEWMTGVGAVGEAHGRRLRELVGRRLTHGWLVWNLDAGEWFADCPVFLDFDGEQLEVNHYKFYEISLTWNAGDPTAPVEWPTDDEFRLAWRDDVPAELVALQGQRLRDVALLEWRTDDPDDLATGSIAVRFEFERGEVTVYNALDENGLNFGPPLAGWRRWPE